MSTSKQIMQVINSHRISNQLLDSCCEKSGGLISNSQYAWFAFKANIVLYSKRLGSVVSSRSFGDCQKDKSLTITYVKELNRDKEKCNLLLIGCSFKHSGLLYICQLPTLTTVRCITLPNPISCIAVINNKSYPDDQFCDEFKIMSTVLLVGMATGDVYAIDLRRNHIENQLSRNEIVINELKPSKLFIMRRNEDCEELKEMSDDNDSHLSIFINENFYAYCKKQYNGKLKLNVSSLLYVEEINTIAIGYSTGYFQLWDCKAMRTMYLLKEPKCIMPITHISFLEPSDDPNNLCYLWVIQSDNSRLPNATMIALTFEERYVTSNGCLAYRVFKGNGVKLEMSLKRETGIGRCVSALSMCNVNLFKNETDMDEDCEIRLFAMLMEVSQNSDAVPESYIFVFDINQWYKAQMPSHINHLKVSNSYASFVKLPYNARYLDFNISNETLRPFGYNFRNNVEELYYPSSIYFECNCLVHNEIIKFKHPGVQQEILDRLISKNWRLLINPTLVFNQCLETNLRPFFWDKTDDYSNYTLPDQRSFVISILIENKIMSVLSACAEQWKNGTYVSTEATILHLVQCLWKHVMAVKQYADKLCVPLFDYSGTQLDKKNERILNHCLSQMQCVKHFLEDLHSAYAVHITNVDYSYRVYTLNLVTQYFKAVICFHNYGLLPESLDEDLDRHTVRCDFNNLIQYANKRRLEFGDSQLYLIDAVVSHEPKGNKLIEQWQHESGEETKGMYPPSNVQCLLRIYLNAALSDQLKNFITIYFLIDICAAQEIDVKIANRMCNFAIEFDVENKALNVLCRASWLLDHDMFEDAMDILSNSKEFAMVKNKSWEWFHWKVLKLLLFKKEYFWARFYMNLSNIDIHEIDDHKFYINLQILNDQYFETLNYILARPCEKHILLEYCFDRCKELKKLKRLIEYPWNKDDEKLFFSYLQKFRDPISLNVQILYLLQCGRYLEAIELNKLSGEVNKLKLHEELELTGLLVASYEKNIPKAMRLSISRPPLKSIYKKTEVEVKCFNLDSKMFKNKNQENVYLSKMKNSSFTPSQSINLIIPATNNTRKRSPIFDVTHFEKRRKLIDDLPSSLKPVDEIPKPIGKQVMEILNTPLVEKTIVSPSIANCSSILKPGSGKHKRVLSIRGDETPVSRNILRFSLPGDEDSIKKELFDSKMEVDIPQVESQESFHSVESTVIDSSNEIVEKESTLNFELSVNNYVTEPVNSDFTTSTLYANEKQNFEHEKMNISEENSFEEPKKINIYKSESVDIETVDLSDDEEPIKNLTKDESRYENKNLYFDKIDEDTINIKIPDAPVPQTSTSSISLNVETIQSMIVSNYSLQPDSQCQEFLIKDSGFQTSNIYSKTNSPKVLNKLSTNSADEVVKLECDKANEEPCIYLVSSSEDENESSNGSVSSDSSSGRKSSDNNSDLEESELNNTKYGRFKYQKNDDYEYEDIDEDKSQQYHRGEVEEEEEEEEGEEEEIEEEGVEEEEGVIEEEEEEGIEEEGVEEEENPVQFNTEEEVEIEDIGEEEEEKEDEEASEKSDAVIEIVDEDEVETEPDNINENNKQNYSNLEITENISKIPDVQEESTYSNLQMYSLISNEQEENNSYENLVQDETAYLSLHTYQLASNETEENKMDTNPCVQDEASYLNIQVYSSTANNAEKNEIDENVNTQDITTLNTQTQSPTYDETMENNINESYVQDEAAYLNLQVYPPASDKAVERKSDEMPSSQDGGVVYSNLQVYSSNFNESRNNEIPISQSKTTDLNQQERPSTPIEVVENKNDDVLNAQNEAANLSLYTYPSISNVSNFETTKSESILMTEDMKHTESTDSISDQFTRSFEVNVNQTPSFLFGESFFGKQEVTDSKPVFLFGHVYSSDKEEPTVVSNEDKPEVKNVVIKNLEEVTNTKESEQVELGDEIQDILELESLPDSNADENLEINTRSRLNSLEPISKENIDEQPQSIDIENINSNEAIESKNEEKCEISVTSSKKKQFQQVQLEERTSPTSTSIELDNINMTDSKMQIQSIVMTNTNQDLKIDNIFEIQNKKSSDKNMNDEMIAPASSIVQSTVNAEIYSEFEKSKTTYEVKQADENIMSLSEQPTSISVSESGELKNFVVDSKQVQLPYVRKMNATLHTSSQQSSNEIRNKRSRVKSTSPTNKLENLDSNIKISSVSKSDEELIDITNVDETVDNVPQNKVIEIVEEKKSESLAANKKRIQYRHEKSDVETNLTGNSQLRTKRAIAKKSVHYDEENKPSTSKSFHEDIDNPEMKKSKVQIPNIQVIKTRSKSKNEVNFVELETNDSNLFRTSEMVVENNRQVRVSLSKKRSKSIENVSSKRRSGRSRSLAPAEDVLAPKKTVFGLDQIPEESSTAENNVSEFGHPVKTRKPKFNFLSSELKNSNQSTASATQLEPRPKTPRRAKSVESGIALTLSTVKARPKRSSSVSLKISKDASPDKDDDYVETLKKALVPPKNTRKRSTSVSMKTKKQKLSRVVEEDDSDIESVSDLSVQTSYSCRQFSPIPGDNLQHMLFTPARKRTMRTGALQFETDENSSSDESTDSRVMTRSMIRKYSHELPAPTLNAEFIKQKTPSEKQIRGFRTKGKSDADKSLMTKQKTKNIPESISQTPNELPNELSYPTERRMTRFQQSIVEKSLQSTSAIEQNYIGVQSVVPAKREKKKKLKKNDA